jgi:hypothetical protein
MVPIYEDYASYTPPVWVRPTVARLLSSLPEMSHNGLASIVLTNSAHADDRYRRQRRNRHGLIAGRYHPRTKGREPWVEILVDRTILPIDGGLSRFQWARDVAVARVLFHELGHHLHATIGSPGRGGEPSAEAWQRRLAGAHFRKRYWYLRPAAPALLRVVNLIRSGKRTRGR